MRILIINEYYLGGGAEEIVNKQLDILKNNGITVKCLCFSKSLDGLIDVELKEGFDIIETKSTHKFIFDYLLYNKIRKFVENFKPDKIIVHNLFSSPLTVFKALKGYEVFQIIHDYYCICPTSLCVYYDGNKSCVCRGYSWECLKKCGLQNNRIKLFLKLQLLKRVEKLRKESVKCVIAPSQKLSYYLYNYGYNSTHINNPIECVGEMQFSRKNRDYIKVIYAGGINQRKGIEKVYQFVEHSNKKFVIHIYGNSGSSDEMNTLKEKKSIYGEKLKYCGRVSHEKLIAKLEEYDYLFVPSMWMENYPTIVLEAMANGIVVIGSDRGGIPEMLDNNRGFIFEYNSLDSLKHCIEKAENISLEEYDEYRVRAYNYVCSNNSKESYYEKLVKVIGI